MIVMNKVHEYAPLVLGCTAFIALKLKYYQEDDGWIKRFFRWLNRRLVALERTRNGL